MTPPRVGWKQVDLAVTPLEDPGNEAIAVVMESAYVQMM